MEQQTKNCPYCGEEILAVAKKCKHCGEWLESKEETKQVVETTEEKEVVSAEVTPKTEETSVSQQAAKHPASEIAPVETYYESQTKKIVWGAITAVLVILTIWFNVSPPEIEFSYIFGTIPYGQAFLFLSIFVLFYFLTVFDEHRKSRIYLDGNGDLDIETPREYEPLSVSPTSKIIGRANIYGQKNLSLFKYYDGRVLIRNSKEHEVEGALSDLTYTYKMDKNKISDEWYIYQFIITDAKGDKVQFNRHNTLFTDEEYADIEMILSMAGTVKEAKISKFTRKADTVLSKISDLDFSDLASSAIIQVGSIATSKITDKAGLLAKKRIYDSLDGSTLSTFAKIKKYGMWALIALLIIVIIWDNAQIIMDTYDSGSERTEYNYEQNYSGSESESYEIASDPAIDEELDRLEASFKELWNDVHELGWGPSVANEVNDYEYNIRASLNEKVDQMTSVQRQRLEEINKRTKALYSELGLNEEDFYGESY